MSGDLVIVVGLNALFFAIIIWVLHRSFQRERTFTDYAVGGRAFGPWYIAMSYVNSWFPGTMYISFLGLGVASGSVGLYVLSYSLLGVMAMYFMATRAWNWGQAFNLRTQPDMMRLRYNSSAVRVSASLIGVISLVPWVALSMQALGVLFSYMTLNQLSTTGALLVGVAVIVVRQYWTVRMGMRGLVITDLVQGIVAYLVCSVMIVAMFFIYFNGFDSLRGLAPQMWDLPGDGGVYGDWYFSAITLTGVIGSLCWPTSYQRIYTASSARGQARHVAVDADHRAFRVAAVAAVVRDGQLAGAGQLAADRVVRRGDRRRWPMAAWPGMRHRLRGIDGVDRRVHPGHRNAAGQRHRRHGQEAARPVTDPPGEGQHGGSHPARRRHRLLRVRRTEAGQPGDHLLPGCRPARGADVPGPVLAPGHPRGRAGLHVGRVRRRGRAHLLLPRSHPVARWVDSRSSRACAEPRDLPRHHCAASAGCGRAAACRRALRSRSMVAAGHAGCVRGDAARARRRPDRAEEQPA